jgi:hypothetical protein
VFARTPKEETGVPIPLTGVSERGIVPLSREG